MSEEVRPVLRFAPSPNGRLHLGHALSALLNEDMARRLGGRLLLRIEDIDPVRSRPDLVAGIFSDLAWLGIGFEEPVRRQSEHFSEHAGALQGLAGRGLAYPCFCSRKQIAATAGPDAARDPDGSPLYPGTCRRLAPEEAARRRAAGESHTWRLDMLKALAASPGPHAYCAFDVEDPAGRSSSHPPPDPRGLASAALERPSRGSRAEPDAPFQAAGASPREEAGGGTTRAADVAHPRGRVRMVPADPSRWGDPVIARRDVPTSYHLAVVLDDAAQGVTHVVRGRDLEAATDLHVLLQRLLGLPSPAYHHHALMLGADGQKLAKSKGSDSLADLRARGVMPDEIRARLGFP